MNFLPFTSTSISFIALSLFAVAGCSSSTSGGGSAVTYDGATAATFSPFCTATLDNEASLMSEAGGGAWEGDGTLHAGAGTPFLLSASFGLWGGFVVQSDGAPLQIDADFTKGLVAGTDFTSSCAPTTIPESGPNVVLADSKLYPNADLSGTECTITAGTTLTNYSFTSLGMANATVSADEITAKCGVATMYAAEFPLGQLVAK